ncbi:hypothetical protein OROMI_004597 [Orobanche minor]
MAEKYSFTKSLENLYSGGPYAISSDGSYMAYARNNNIMIVNTDNPCITWCLDGIVPNPITALVVKPESDTNKQTLLSASGQRIQVWDLVTLEPNHDLSWDCEHDVKAMAYASSGKLIAIAHIDGIVIVWELKTRKKNIFRAHTKAINTLIFNPASDVLYSGSDDGTIIMRFLNNETKKVFHNNMPVVSLAISQGGNGLISLGRNETDTVAKIWNVNDPTRYNKIVFPRDRIIAIFPVDPRKMRWLVEWIPCRDSICLITVVERPSVILSIFSPGRARQDFDIGLSSAMTKGFKSAMLLQNNKELLCFSYEDEFVFYGLRYLSKDKGSKAPLDTITLQRRVLGYDDISDINFFFKESISCGFHQWPIRVYEIALMSRVFVSPVTNVVCFDACDTKLITVHNDNIITLWDVKQQKILGISRDHKNPIRAIAISKHKKEFVVSCSSDGTLWVWKIDWNNQLINIASMPNAHPEEISSLAINRDDKLVCSGCSTRETARLWILSNQGLRHFKDLNGHTKGVSSISFSHDCVIIVSNEKLVKVWHSINGSVNYNVRDHEELITRALSIDDIDIKLISCGCDHGLKLWSAKTDLQTAIDDNKQNGKRIRALTTEKYLIATVGSDAARTINMWRTEEKRALDDIVNAYLSRYPDRRYEVPCFHMHGLRLVDNDMNEDLNDGVCYCVVHSRVMGHHHLKTCQYCGNQT